jgi:hypothetical protein
VSISQYLSGKCSPTGANAEKLRVFISENSGVEIPKIKKYSHILNAKEAAEKFGIPAQTLKELAKTGKFEWAVAYKGRGTRNIYRFFVRKFQMWNGNFEELKNEEENEEIQATAEILL